MTPGSSEPAKIPSPYAPSAAAVASVALPAPVVATLLVDACLWMSGDDGIRPTRHDVGAGAWALAFIALRERSSEAAAEVDEQLSVMCSENDREELVELIAIADATGGLSWSDGEWLGLTK